MKIGCRKLTLRGQKSILVCCYSDVKEGFRVSLILKFALKGFGHPLNLCKIKR